MTKERVYLQEMVEIGTAQSQKTGDRAAREPDRFHLFLFMRPSRCVISPVRRRCPLGESIGRLVVIWLEARDVCQLCLARAPTIACDAGDDVCDVTETVNDYKWSGVVGQKLLA